MAKNKATKRDMSDQPYIENYPPLKEWLDKHEARCMWQLASQPEWQEHGLEYPQFYVECWIFPTTKKLAIIACSRRLVARRRSQDPDRN